MSLRNPRPDVQVNFTRVTAAASFARPNNTTSYTAGDVVSTGAGAILEFDNCARENGGAGMVRGVTLKKSRTGVTNAVFRLHLFTVAPAAIADNAAWQTVWADRANHVGYVDLTMTTEGGTNETPTAFAACNVPFQCAGADIKLYGVICAEAAYGPYALEEFVVSLAVESF